MTNKLKIQNLHFDNVLKDINLNLNEGTINALMGNSGSGKTLLFKSIFGLVENSGIIELNDVILTKENIEEVRKNIGIYLVSKELSEVNVFQNIILPLNNLNYEEDKAKKKVYEISKKLGIENLLYKNINTLSYAQKKVVLFAQTVIHSPKVVLLDNFIDSLDTYYNNKIISYIKYLKKSKKSIIIFVTNNSENLWLCDNLIIMKNGKLIVNENIQEILKDENVFTKNNVKLPFLSDLSNKLKTYELIDKDIYDMEEMVDEIWQ